MLPVAHVESCVSRTLSLSVPNVAEIGQVIIKHLPQLLGSKTGPERLHVSLKSIQLGLSGRVLLGPPEDINQSEL